MLTSYREEDKLLVYLLRIATQLGGENYIRPYVETLRRLITKQRYGALHEPDADILAQQGAHSITSEADLTSVHFASLVAQAEQIRLLHDEIGLGLISFSAILFYPPCLYGHMSLEEVSTLCPEGTSALVNRLIDTHRLYTRYDLRRESEGEEFLLSIAQDIRVVLILLVETFIGLLNARERMSEEARRQLAQEAQVLFVPIAHRLGLYKIKSQMEDLIFKYTDPEHYYMLKEQMGQTLRARQSYIERFVAPLQERLKILRWPYTLKSRAKTFSSIMHKIQTKGIPFEEIYDLSAIRVIIDAPPEEEYEACWRVYSIVTDLYTPNIKRLRDWISHPKPNGYESLQITVEGPENQNVEVQIRTERMDRIAESGMAAHWRYKGLEAQSTLDSQLTSMRQVIEELSRGSNKEEQISLRVESRDIFAFTPTGQMLRLPKGATVLDFAFAIHSQVGITAHSARINGQRAKLRDHIKNGDIIEITTQRQQKPSVDWLQYVSTRKAKNKIRQALREQQERGLQAAKELLERRFKNRHLTYDESIFNNLIRQQGYKGNMAFFIDLSEDKVNITQFLDLYAQAIEDQTPVTRTKIAPPLSSPQESTRSGAVIIVSSQLKGIAYTLASCCQPQVGDAIFAYPTKSGLKIHTRQCPNAIDILGRHGDRVLPARWEGVEDEEISSPMRVVAEHSPELIARIVSLCRQNEDIQLLSESQYLDGEGIWHGSFMLTSTLGRQALYTLQGQIETLKGVLEVQF